VGLTKPCGQSWGKAAACTNKIQDQACFALVPHLAAVYAPRERHYELRCDFYSDNKDTMKQSTIK